MARASAKKRPATKKAKKASKPKKKPAAKPQVKASPKKATPKSLPAKKNTTPKGRPAPPKHPAAAKKGSVKEGKGAKGRISDLDHVAGEEPHEGDAEAEPPIPVVRHETPLPPPSRRKPKPGSPDWPGESLTVGMEAPEFSLPASTGGRITLSQFRGRRVVLYFYPKDDTPGCTMEACAFRDNLSRIESKDAVVLGVSLDDELSHQRFAQKYGLTFPLLSDVDAAISRRYGTYKEKSLYGRTFWGIERTTFVIDREGKVENVFRRVKVEGHADEVLATLSV
ncbi:MAG TPA: thioredoxin-dependent thiol peroxidase [Candidatus Eisenbacteria bacterium]|nr:thioredoxin-dependent thiol peroxidase [Candidatus Eisenbacteria bacterium]